MPARRNRPDKYGHNLLSPAELILLDKLQGTGEDGMDSFLCVSGDASVVVKADIQRGPETVLFSEGPRARGLCTKGFLRPLSGGKVPRGRQGWLRAGWAWYVLTEKARDVLNETRLQRLNAHVRAA